MYVWMDGCKYVCMYWQRGHARFNEICRIYFKIASIEKNGVHFLAHKGWPETRANIGQTDTGLQDYEHLETYIQT